MTGKKEKKRKYNYVDVDNALERWQDNKNSKQQIFFSRLYNVKEISTTLFVVKIEPLALVNCFNHHYLEFDDCEWHPGSPSNPIFISRQIRKNTKICKILELCNVCAIKFMLNLFKFDSQFNLFFKNCQSILGDVTQTLLFWAFVFCLGFGLILKIVPILMLALVLVLSFVLSTFSEARIILQQCEHVSNKTNSS